MWTTLDRRTSSLLKAATESAAHLRRKAGAPDPNAPRLVRPLWSSGHYKELEKELFGYRVGLRSVWQADPPAQRAA